MPLGKQLNIRLSEEEMDELKRLAEEKGVTIKDLVVQGLKHDHSIPEVSPINERNELHEEYLRLKKEHDKLMKEPEQEEREIKENLAEESPVRGKMASASTKIAPASIDYSWAEVSEAVKSAIKEGDSWLGFELEPVAEALAKLHLEWHELREADKLALLGKYKLQAQLEEYSTERVAKDLTKLSDAIKNCDACEHQIMHFYHRIKVKQRLVKVVEDGEEKQKTVWNATLADSDED